MWSLSTAATDGAAARAARPTQAVAQAGGPTAAKLASVPGVPVGGFPRGASPPATANAAAPRPAAPRATGRLAGGTRPAGVGQQYPPKAGDAAGQDGGSAEVLAFLDGLGLGQYGDVLLSEGFDDMDTLMHIEDADMRALGVNACHVVKLRRRLSELRQGPAGAGLAEGGEVVGFLREVGLSQYAEVLLQSGFDELQSLVDIADNDMRDLGIPRGHAVKLRRCLGELELPQARRQPQQTPLKVQPAPLRASTANATVRRLPAQQRAFGEKTGPVPDSQTKSAVEQSWERVQAIGSDTVGEMLYRHTFALEPSLVALFPVEVRHRYRDWTADEGTDESSLYQSPALRKLFSKFVNAIGSTVAGLRDFSRLVPMLSQLGQRHASYGLSEEHWPILGKALILTLRDCLGSAFTPEVESAWAMVFGFMSNIMIEGLRSALAEKHDKVSASNGDDGHSECSSGLATGLPPSEGGDITSKSSWTRLNSDATQDALDEEDEDSFKERADGSAERQHSGGRAPQAEVSM